MTTPHTPATGVATATATAERPSLPFMLTRAKVAPHDAVTVRAEGEDATTPSPSANAGQGRPAGHPLPADMPLINRFARTPLTPDQVYVVPTEISNQSVDSYFTRMTPTTLANYARDASAGVAFLDSHEKRRLPMGKSFYGQVVADPARDMLTTQSLLYMRRGMPLSNGMNTNDVIDGLEAGIYADTSVSFVPERFWCSICHRDMLSDPECWHVPGMRYEDAQGQVLLCVADVDACLAEYSLVYHHATDGASVLPPSALQLKVERLLAEGRATLPMLRFAEEVTHVRMFDRYPGVSLPTAHQAASSRVVSAQAPTPPPTTPTRATPAAAPPANGEDQDMTGAEFVRGVLAHMERAGAEISAANHAAVTAILRDMEESHGSMRDAMDRLGGFLATKAPGQRADNDQNPDSEAGNAESDEANDASAKQGMDMKGKGGKQNGVDEEDAHNPTSGRAAPTQALTDTRAAEQRDPQDGDGDQESDGAGAQASAEEEEAERANKGAGKGVDTDANTHDPMTTRGKGHMHGDLLMHQHEDDNDHAGVPKKNRAEGEDKAEGQDSRPNGDGAGNDSGASDDSAEEDGEGGSRAGRAVAQGGQSGALPAPTLSDDERALIAFAREQKSAMVEGVVADAVRVYGTMTDEARAAYVAVLENANIAQLKLLHEQGRAAAKAALSPVGQFHRDDSAPGGGHYDDQPTGVGGRQTVARNPNDPMSLTPAGAQASGVGHPATAGRAGASYSQGQAPVTVRHEGYGAEGVLPGVDPSLYSVGPTSRARRPADQRKPGGASNPQAR